MRRHAHVLIAAAVLAATLAGSVAWATTPDGNGLYTACKLNATGTIRLIDPAGPPASLLSRCTSHETKVTWNQKGAQGEPGAAGPAGPSGSTQVLRTPPSSGGPLSSFGPRGATGMSEIVSLNLDPGTWVVNVMVVLTNLTDYPVAAECVVSPGPGGGAGAARQTMDSRRTETLSFTAVVTGPAVARLLCATNGPPDDTLLVVDKLMIAST